MLDIKDVICEYKDGIKALDKISLHIDDGESVGLIGANGAGKSSLFRCITGLNPFEGSITADGSSDIREIRRKVGYVIQESDDQMFMPTVMDDMIFGPVNYGMSRDEAVKKSERILADLNISHLRDRRNHRISGGEKKMAAIAVILAMEPELILFDEPTSSLDPKNRRAMIRVLRDLKKSFIVASHDLDLVMDTCNRVVLINNGHIIKDGPSDEILRDKDLLEANGLELPLSLQKRA